MKAKIDSCLSDFVGLVSLATLVIIVIFFPGALLVVPIALIVIAGISALLVSGRINKKQEIYERELSSHENEIK